jgi:hypothetical protein
MMIWKKARPNRLRLRVRKEDQFLSDITCIPKLSMKIEIQEDLEESLNVNHEILQVRRCESIQHDSQ